ncbi:MAG: alpha/beta hydrolase [Candidatus Magasanikbacteria bacterium]|nr:alpha/beta hydrolase [Candidatus Magasanikbacteria bacterium]
MHFEKKYFQEHGAQLRYFQAGAGRPILFLHGGGAKAMSYKKILKLLAKNYQVIAPDLPCFGKSSCPDSFSTYSDILVSFVASLPFEKIAVVGHSMGGAVGLQLAASSKKISHLVIVDSAGVALKISRGEFLYNFFIKKTFRDLWDYKNPRLFFRGVRTFFENVFSRLPEFETAASIVEKFLTSNFQHFDKISAETLIIWGEQDEIFPVEFARTMQRNIERSELQLVDGNHDWCAFRVKRFVRIVEGWIKMHDVNLNNL